MKSIILKIIWICLVILVVLLIVMARINVKSKNNEFNKEGTTDFVKDSIIDENVLQKVESHQKYYTVINIIAKYYGYIGRNEIEPLSKILSPDYLKNHEVEDEIVKIQSQDPIFYAENINFQTNGQLYIYYVKGKVKEYLDSDESQEVYLQIYMDDNTNSFEIMPIHEKTYNNIVIKGNLLNVKKVENNEYNKFNYMTITEKTKAAMIFNNYKQFITGDIEEAYNRLNKEYSQKKFENLELYKQYINKRTDLNYSILSKYTITSKDGYTEYICIDQNENQFIFKETTVMDYTVMLDNYTIDTQEFIDEYNVASPQGKTALNIDKFIKSVNDKDYNYAYNCLSDGFRTNYFGTLEDFERYVNENLYTNNEIQYKEFEEEGGLYKYTINIINADDTNQILEKTIIMKLNDGTDFEMSFNI